MSAKRKGTALFVFFAVTCISLLLWTGCANPGGGSSVTSTPPQVMQGTVAFGNQSAVITLTVGGVKSVGRSAVQSRSIYSVGGKIRFQGQDFAINGDYDDVAGAITATTATVAIGGQSIYFDILGVYTDATGFRGSVKKYVNAVLTDNGSVSAVGATVTEVNSGAIKTFTGTFSGSSSVHGTWNMTLKGNTGYGSYSGSSAGSAISGVVSGSSNGTTVTLDKIFDSSDLTKQVIGSGTGTISGNYLSGTWNVSSASGIWTGKETTSSGDANPPASTDPIANQCIVIYQVFNALAGSVDFSSGTGPIFYNAAGTVAATVATFDATHNSIAFAATNYVDATYGVKVNGTVTEVVGLPPGQEVSSVVGSVNFDWTSAAISLSITSLQLNLTSINWVAKSLSGSIYYNGGATDIKSYYQTLLFP
jgi:hypothetical protein